MKRPSPDDMHVAAMWLEIYEGAEDAAPCHRVAAWLKAESDKTELDQAARKAAKATGRSFSECRSRLRQMMTT